MSVRAARPSAPAPSLARWARVDAGPFAFGARAAALVPAADRPTFGPWMATARPEHLWTAPHFGVMQGALDGVTAGTHRRVFFQVPIRHGKTEHNTVGYAVYRLAHDPTFRWLVGSYNQRQADKLSREIRRLARAMGVAISTERDTVSEWETTAGGGVRAVGAGAGVASVNADGILIDDPIGSRDEAESPAHRDRVWDWLTSDLLARAEPHTAVLMSMSRWHQDDPAGRLMDRHAGRWQVVDLPALAEANDPLGRAEGDPLWPALRGADWLEEKRAELGAYGFASLLQGRPRPREGGMFRWDWWTLLEATPAAGAFPQGLVRYWDLAGTEPKGGRHDPDYSAGVLGGRLTDGRTCIADVARFRHSVGQRDAALDAQARADVQAWGRAVRWWIETEAGIAGADRTAALVRRLQACGLAVHTERPSGSKVVRAEPLASAAEARNVCLAPDAHLAPERQWRDAFRAECADFPAGTHDDAVDAAAGMFNKLAVPRATVSLTRFSL